MWLWVEGIRLHVLMLLSNPFKPDPRVYEEAKALVEEGYGVTVLAWDREKRFKEREIVDGIHVMRIKVKGGYGNFKNFFPGLIKFYRKALKVAKSLEYDVVHAHDFDTLPLGIFIARRGGVPLIYDVHDDYASMIQESVPKIIALVVDILHKLIIRFPDEVIYASYAYPRILQRKGTIIMNCKDPNDYNIDVEELKNILKIKGFTIVYIGIFRQIEFLRLLINLTKMIGANLIIGGDGPYKREVLDMIKGEEKIKYLGWIKANDIPKYTKLADIIIILNNPNKRYDRSCLPVKLFEAMAAGVPIIVSKDTEAARIVEKERCGLTVEFGNVDELVSAIEKIKKEGKELGANGLKAAKMKYNRNEQMKRLKKLYRKLLS